MEVIV